MMHDGIHYALLGAVEVNDDLGNVFTLGKFFDNRTLADASRPFDKECRTAV